jgi:hypothetical protein
VLGGGVVTGFGKDDKRVGWRDNWIDGKWKDVKVVNGEFDSNLSDLSVTTASGETLDIQVNTDGSLKANGTAAERADIFASNGPLNPDARADKQVSFTLSLLYLFLPSLPFSTLQSASFSPSTRRDSSPYFARPTSRRRMLVTLTIQNQTHLTRSSPPPTTCLKCASVRVGTSQTSWASTPSRAILRCKT